MVLDPAPKIDIKSEIIYANDSVIGYKYDITLNGIAIDDSVSFAGTISKISSIRSVLSQNGSTLEVSNDSIKVIEAFGGILVDLTFDSENSFSRYSTYTATLSFNELNILNDSFSCSSGQIPNSSFSTDLLDINKYKIKEFKDNWTFNLDAGILNFNNYDFQPSGLKINNTQIEVSYDISAEGLSYFNANNEIVVPWIQAKNFVQDRLFDQIKNFHSKEILSIDNDIACGATTSLSGLYSNSNKNIFKNPFPYSVYNETIECATSESNGTFSAKYNAILKFDDVNSEFGDNSATHTFTKVIKTDYEGNKEVVSVSVQGTIQGLNSSNLATNLIFGTFALPNNGKLLVSGSNIDKLNNAIKIKNKIINNTEDDLTLPFKSGLQIIPLSGEPFNIPICSGSGDMTPSTFSLTTNYFLGTINYNAEYTIDKTLSYEASGVVIFNTSIDVEKPKKIYAELPIVGGNYVIQDLMTVTNQKINIVVEGRKKHNKCGQPNLNDIKNIMNEFVLPAPTGLGFILTNKNVSYNFPNNSFTMNVSYLCKSGCYI